MLKNLEAYGLLLSGAGKQRRQLSLLLCACALGLCYGLYVSRAEYHDQLGRLQREQSDSDRIEQLLQQAQQQKGANSPKAGNPSQTVLSLVTDLARQHALPLARYRPQGDTEVLLWMENVPAASVFLWLDDIGRAESIRIKQFTMQRSGEIGLADVQLRLVRIGGGASA